MQRTKMVRLHGRFGTVLLAAALVVIGSLASPVMARIDSARLQPSPVGTGQCSADEFSDHSVYAQIAVSGASCSQVSSVAAEVDHARGAGYKSDGFTCTATREAAGSKWASAWGGTYYAYSCVDGSHQLASNWGADYTFGQAQPSPTEPSSNPFVSGRLQPSPLGSGACEYTEFSDHSVYAQIAVSGASCSQVSSVAAEVDHARGAGYKSDGFTCTATREAAGSKWASAWGGTYYAYSCVDGSHQLAFNWGTDYTY